MFSPTLKLENPNQNQKPLKCIWDDDHIKKHKDGWECLWCKTYKKGVNASRALSHVAGIFVHNTVGVCFCSAEIPEEGVAVLDVGKLVGDDASDFLLAQEFQQACRNGDGGM